MGGWEEEETEMEERSIGTVEVKLGGKGIGRRLNSCMLEATYFKRMAEARVLQAGDLPIEMLGRMLFDLEAGQPKMRFH